MDIYFEKLAAQIDAVIQAHKSKVAYIMGDQEVTYAQMDDMARHIASGVARMVEKNPGDSDVPVRIGIALGRNQHFVPCILAAMKLGCSYVPIDVENPQERKDFISKDASLSVLITSANIGQLLASPMMDKLPVLSRGVSEAYMIYTSGTTGQPKGVSQPYRTLYSYMQTVCLPDNFNVSENSVVLQFASISFDVSVLEVFSMLCYGGTLVIAQNEEKHNPLLVYRLMKEKGITYTFMPPSLLAVFPDYDFPAMDTLSAGGEAIPHSLTSKIAGKYPYRFVNGYGPTESIVTTTHEIEGPDDWKNIGKPVPGVVCYVADENGKLVAPGEQGELLIGGMQLTNGYWNRPELNAKMFFENPYEKEHDGIDVSRLYHSGDLVVLNKDGSFDYIGRKDHQIKLHGYRIELGEITTQIERQEGVLRAFVRLEEIGNEKYIVAYVRTADNVKNLNDIRQKIAKQLPVYMVPTFWNHVADFKLNINGKIDKTTLVNNAVDSVITNNTPITPHEELLMQAMASLLGLPSVNVEADLINDVGITSLHIMQLTVQLAVSGMHLTTNDFYSLRTIRKIMAADQHPNYFWYGDGGKDPEKPVIIAISGLTSFSFIFGEWADRISHKFDVFVIESYHTIMEDQPTDVKSLVNIYMDYVKDVVNTHKIVAITGFCTGGEQGLELARRLYNNSEYKPPVIVLDGELDRDMSVQRRTIESYFFPFYSKERNLRRAELDIHLMETQPEEPYNGPVTALLSASYTSISPISGTEKKPDIVELELIEHNNKGERWRRRYPNCELVTVPGNHNEFLITQESKDAVVDYFLKNI
ncbi:MAG: non-ribosomal peptide synthetase [Bacteroidales bacterium]|nr:non-ribosomal peptide synthetase [Bacteroidales bacterium]